MTALVLPAGFSSIQGGTLMPLANSTLGAGPIEVAPFAMAQTPVTNAQWAVLTQGLGPDRFLLLNHNWETGTTSLVRRGKTADAAAMGPVHVTKGIDFDHGDVMIFGSHVLVKMVDSPSAQYDAEGKVFSRVNQPVVGITYFHANAWCLLKNSDKSNGWLYKLPTDPQYEYVASDRGTKEFGTENGKLFGPDGRRLAHIEEYGDSRGATVAVDDSRYIQNLPFDVQTTGNVWRWIQMNPAFKSPSDFFVGSFGLRGGSWDDLTDDGRATCRGNGRPDGRCSDVGFSPVVVRQDS